MWCNKCSLSGARLNVHGCAQFLFKAQNEINYVLSQAHKQSGDQCNF